MKQPVKRTELVEKIKKGIADGTYPSGFRFPIEKEFSRELGVARETLRGALKLLETENYITRIVGQGTFVRGSNARDLFFLIPCPDYFIRSNYTTRAATGQILSGCLGESHLLNFHVVPLSISRTNSQNDIDWRTLDQLPEGARIVFYSNWFHPVYPLLQAKKCRVMMIRNTWQSRKEEGKFPDEWASCYLDEFSAFVSHVELLHSLGCRRIMVISGYLDNPENPRKAGYLEGIRRCGLQTEEMTFGALSAMNDPQIFKQCVQDLYREHRFDALLISIPDSISVDYGKTLNGNLGLPEEIKIITEFEYEYNNSLKKKVASYSYDYSGIGTTLSRILFMEEYHKEEIKFKHFYINKEVLNNE